VKALEFGLAILRGAGALPRLTQVDRIVCVRTTSIRPAPVLLGVGLDHRWFPAILPISLTSCFCGLLLLRFGF
jgi:hypothetical protein